MQSIGRECFKALQYGMHRRQTVSTLRKKYVVNVKFVDGKPIGFYGRSWTLLCREHNRKEGSYLNLNHRANYHSILHVFDSNGKDQVFVGHETEAEDPVKVEEKGESSSNLKRKFHVIDNQNKVDYVTKEISPSMMKN